MLLLLFCRYLNNGELGSVAMTSRLALDDLTQGRSAGCLGCGCWERSEVGEQKRHVIKELSEGSGGEGHHGLRWVFVGFCFEHDWGFDVLCWKFCRPGTSLGWPIGARVFCSAATASLCLTAAGGYLHSVLSHLISFRKVYPCGGPLRRRGTRLLSLCLFVCLLALTGLT